MKHQTFLSLSVGPDDHSNQNLTFFLEQRRKDGKPINDADMETLALAISDKIAALMPHLKAKKVSKLESAFFHLSSLRKLAKATLLAHENWATEMPTSKEICAMLNLTPQEFTHMSKVASQYEKQQST